jgi:NADH-quinone oxidoreductase subunit L
MAATAMAGQQIEMMGTRRQSKGRAATLREEWHGVGAFVAHGLAGAPFWFAVAGIGLAWLLYIRRPDLPAKIQARTEALYALLANNYYVDRFNDWFFAGGFRRTGSLFSEIGDRSMIDGFFVNGSARMVGAASASLRLIQSGYMYLYAFAMILGVFIALFWWVVLRVV